MLRAKWNIQFNDTNDEQHANTGFIYGQVQCTTWWHEWGAVHSHVKPCLMNEDQ